jgi:outer membrane protein assembly factor BamB
MNILSRARIILIILALVWSFSLSAGDWNQWRGPERNGKSAADEFVPQALAPEPKVVWRLEIGGGFSSPIVAGDNLVYLDAQEAKEVVHVIDARSGKERWRAAFGEMYEDEWGPGPRCTPILDEDRLYVQSCKGEFCCFNLPDGKVKWGTSFAKDFGVRFLGSKANEGTASRRGNDGSGVIDGNRIILPVGSSEGASLVCFDKLTGKILWKSQNDEAAYSSLMLATLAGVKQVVYFSADALMGIEAEHGTLLWRVALRTDAKRHAATPVIVGDTVIVNSQTIGLVCTRITKEGAGLKAAPAWVDKDLKINISTPVLADHFLYGQGMGRNFVCVDAANGKLMWSQEGFGDKYSAAILVGNHLLVTTDRGELVLVAADSAKFTSLGRAQVTGKTWNHPAYSNGRLYLREGLTSGWKLTCFELRPANSTTAE